MKAFFSHRFFYWLPRVASLLFIFFISLFALDSPDFLGLIIHLLPSFVLIMVLAIAWKSPFVGGILFIVSGLAATIFFHAWILGLIPGLLGMLFLAAKPRR